MTLKRPVRGKRVDEAGRAFAGSQLQLQIYVNRHQSDLSRAVSRAFDLECHSLHWISPLELTAFKEYRDGEFLQRLGLSALTERLRGFWPTRGPRWDGLAAGGAGANRVVVLVEAKNYPNEVRGGGCKATDKAGARKRIVAALRETGAELGVPSTEHWLGPLYQYANRLAHAAFLRRCGVQTCMVNVCFAGDPHPPRHTTVDQWRAACTSLKVELGLTIEPTWLADVILPARARAELLAPPMVLLSDK